MILSNSRNDVHIYNFSKSDLTKKKTSNKIDVFFTIISIEAHKLGSKSQ